MPLSPLTTKLRSFMKLSTTELSYLQEMDLTFSEVCPHSTLFDEGERLDRAFVLMNGWGCCFKLLENGRRQIINFAVPGDFLGFRSILFHTSDHSFSAISSCLVCGFSRAQIREIFDNQPRLALAFLWSMSRDGAILTEHLVNLGRRTALESMAHLLLELLYRVRLVGFGKDNEIECALTQDDVADALGLSSIHVNRVLRTLRNRQIVTFRSRKIVYHDVGKLAALAGYDSGYLDQPPVGLS